MSPSDYRWSFLQSFPLSEVYSSKLCLVQLFQIPFHILHASRMEACDHASLKSLDYLSIYSFLST